MIFFPITRNFCRKLYLKRREEAAGRNPYRVKVNQHRVKMNQLRKCPVVEMFDVSADAKVREV